VQYGAGWSRFPGPRRRTLSVRESMPPPCAKDRVSRTVNIALFGGTFDPIHAGHMRAAKVAARKFRLGRILFVPSGNPPHKRRDRLTPFVHRFAMVALACQGDLRFVPSLLEAPRPGRRPHYSIETARAASESLGPADDLYFLLGLDAFLDLPHWKNYRHLFDLMDFIVVSRPGFGSAEILKVVPRRTARGGIHGSAAAVRGSTRQKGAVHVLSGVHVPVASRDIREAVAARRRVTGLVPSLVEEYIRKEGLYTSV
jgi:nicotinate-nucleotide adenylyltransferase